MERLVRNDSPTAIISRTNENTHISLLLRFCSAAGGFFGLIYLPSIVSVGYYFTSKRALATGIAVCGSGMGAFSFAPMVSWLLESYHWKTSLRILASKFESAIFQRINFNSFH